MLRAIRTFTDDEYGLVKAGLDRVAADHPLADRYPESFEPAPDFPARERSEIRATPPEGGPPQALFLAEEVAESRERVAAAARNPHAVEGPTTR